jgi:hypothetical protein
MKMPGVDWTLLSDALLRVERLSAEDSGLLSFGLEERCGVFVEKGRICWVAARGLSRRLRDLLVGHSHLDAAALESVFERCRAEGKPVGEALVAAGVIAPEALARALRHHSAECLLELCRAPLPTRWASRPGRGYAPRFTFSPVELLLDAVAISFPEHRTRALAELARLEAPGRRAVAFVFDPARDCMLPVAELGGQGVSSLRMLAYFATAMPRASLELAAAPTLTMASTRDGEAALVWWVNGLLFVVLCEDRASLAAATAQQLACA